MPFEELETCPKGTSGPPMATLSYLIGGHKNRAPKASDRPKLVVCIPTTICGMSKSQTFRLAIGIGEDAGKLMVRGDLLDKPVKGGAKQPPGCEPSQLKHYFRWHFGFVPRFGEEKFGPDKHRVSKVSDEEFLIEIPQSWCEPLEAS